MKSTKNDQNWRYATFSYPRVVKMDDRLRQLGEDDWELISAILYKQTKAALNSTRFRGERGGPVPGGREIADFMHDAFLMSSDKLLEWDGQLSSLTECLWKIITRLIKRYSARHENKKERGSTMNPAEANSHVADVSKVRQTCYPEPEDSACAEEKIRRIMKKFRKNRDFKYIKVIVFEGLETPQEIAERLGVEVEEVNNAKKRLRRNPYLLSLKRRKGGGNSS